MLSIIVCTYQLAAQVPQKMSFQVVVRKSNNALVMMQPITMRISILQGNANGNLVFQETHTPITNTNGLVSLQIGTGVISSGIFANINWANGPYYIKTETDPEGGSNYSIVGVTEFLSVPYALFALNSIGIQGPQGLTGLTGAAGTNGTKGINGIDGAIGATGPTGAIGQQGLIGITGDKGIQGVPGAMGFPGLNGTNGINGIDGVLGATGLTGAAGPKGIIGFTGPQGFIGFTGPPGAAGSQGIQGVIGVTGLTGSVGATGPQGFIGFTGPPGAAGSQGIQGIIGVIGNTGPTGATGLTGSVGANGAIGVTGPSGGFDPLTILLPSNGGTGIANNILSTLTITGANPITITNTGVTAVTLPIGGTLYGTATASISSAALLNSLSDKTGTGNAVFATSPEFIAIPTAPTAAPGTSTTQLATTAFVMQNLQSFTVAAASEINTSSTTDVVAGELTLTPGTGKYYVTFNSQYSIIPSDRTGQSKDDLRTAYNSLMAKANTVTSHVPTYGGGETLTAGVYANAGACTAVGNLTLDGGGNPNAEFVFKFGAAFSTAALTTIILINGASACNVYWIAEGAIALGVSTSMQGTIISNNGAVTAGNSCTMVGRLYSNNGAVGLDGSSVSLPTGCTSSTNFGMINSFAAFTSVGNVTNLGASLVTGDIGTNFGTVTGFGTATVIGTIYEPSIVPASTTASFGIFRNGVLIPYSTRTRTSTQNLGEISLSGIATVGVGEPIDIRWKIDSGTIKFQNRILTLIAVK
jgi:hypothetical protein